MSTAVPSKLINDQIKRLQSVAVIPLEEFGSPVTVFGYCLNQIAANMQGIFFLTDGYAGFFGSKSKDVFSHTDLYMIGHVSEAGMPTVVTREQYGRPVYVIVWTMNVTISNRCQQGQYSLELMPAPYEASLVQALMDNCASRKLIAIPPSMAPVVDQAAELMIDQRPGQAMELLNTVLPACPNNPRVKTQLGKCLFQMGDLDNSLRILTEVDSGEADETIHMVTGVTLADLYWRTGQHDRALEKLESTEIMEESSLAQDAVRIRAHIHLEKSNLPEALENVYELISDDPGNFDALVVGLASMIHPGQYRGAIEWAELILENTDASVFPMLEAANAFVAGVQLTPAQVIHFTRAARSLGFYKAMFTGELEPMKRVLKSTPAQEMTCLHALFAELINDWESLSKCAGIEIDRGEYDADFRSLTRLIAAAALSRAGEGHDRIRAHLDEFVRQHGSMEHQVGEDVLAPLIRVIYNGIAGRLANDTGSEEADLLEHFNRAIAEMMNLSLPGLTGSEINLQYLMELQQFQVVACGGRLPGRQEGPSLTSTGDGSGTSSDRSTYELALNYLKLLSRSPENFSLSRKISEALEVFDRPLLITVLGEFDVGKSTFINALIGDSVAPMDVVPTTATINQLKYGDEKKLRIRFRDSRVEEAEIHELERFVKESKDESDQQLLRRIEHVEILYPIESLKLISIVDTPGLNAIISEHQETTEAFMEKSDAVVWLFRADAAGKKSEKEKLELLRKYKKKTIGVVNQIDLIEDDDEIDLVLDTVKENLGEYLSDVIGISARDALSAKETTDKEEANRLMVWSRFEELETHLRKGFTEQSREIKEHALLGKLRIVDENIRGQMKEVVSKHNAHLEEIGKLNEEIVTFQNEFREQEKQYQKTFHEGLDALSDSLAERAVQLFTLLDEEEFSEEDLMGAFSSEASEEFDLLFARTRLDAVESAAKFKAGLDTSWRDIIEQYDPSLTHMFSHLQGYYEAKLKDLDKYFESERFYFDGYITGLLKWRSLVEANRGGLGKLMTGFTGKHVETSNAYLSTAFEDIRAEMGERHNKRLQAWLEELCSQLDKFTSMIRTTVVLEHRRKLTGLYWPVQRYYDACIDPAIEETEARMMQASSVAGSEATGSDGDVQGSPSLLSRLQARYKTTEEERN